jgi:hypothetical protein
MGDYRHPRRPRALLTPTQTVASLRENAGVPEGAAADILGHDKPTMTYGPYSGGASLKVKREGHHREADVSARGSAVIAMAAAVAKVSHSSSDARQHRRSIRGQT